MKLARRPTITSLASITIHFCSTSAGFSATVVLVFMTFRVRVRRRGDYRPGRSLSIEIARDKGPQRLIGQWVDQYGNIIPYQARRPRQSSTTAAPSTIVAKAWCVWLSGNGAWAIKV